MYRKDHSMYFKRIVHFLELRNILLNCSWIMHWLKYFVLRLRVFFSFIKGTHHEGHILNVNLRTNTHERGGTRTRAPDLPLRLRVDWPSKYFEGYYRVVINFFFNFEDVSKWPSDKFGEMVHQEQPKFIIILSSFIYKWS